MLIIHPMWLIDEYAKMARRCVWFIPIIPPTIELSAATYNKMFLVFWIKINDKTLNGASFCHVDKIAQDAQGIDIITDGYHMWQGTIPNFNKIENINIYIKDLSLIENIIHIDILLINKMEDPIDWARKYLIEASVSWFSCVNRIIGMNLNKLISIDAHSIIQLVLDIAIKVLVIMVITASIENGIFIVMIKIWRRLAP